jgi:hypothetical protein
MSKKIDINEPIWLIAAQPESEARPILKRGVLVAVVPK